MATEIAAKRHELVGFIIFLFAVFIFLCLISYDPGDTSFNVLTYKLGVENRVGKIGAYASDLLFQVLGLSAFLLLLPLVLLSWKLVCGRRIEAPYMRAAGFLAILCVTSTSLQLFPVPVPSVNFQPGGITGVLLSNMLLPNLNLTGTIILLFGALVVGLLASTRLSLGSALTQAAREEALAGS